MSLVNVRQVHGCEASADCRVIDGRHTVVLCRLDAGCRVATCIHTTKCLFGVCFTHHLIDTIYRPRRQHFSVTCYVIVYSGSPAAITA